MRRDCEGHLIEMDLNKHAHSIQTYRRTCTRAFIPKLYRVRLNKANTEHMIRLQTDSVKLHVRVSAHVGHSDRDIGDLTERFV